MINPRDLTDEQLSSLLSRLRSEKDAAQARMVELREEIMPFKQEVDRRTLQASRERRAARILAGEDEDDKVIRMGR